jgi:hypothetical protein
MRIRIAATMLLLGAIAGTTPAGHAGGSWCASYEVTAPGVGTQADGICTLPFPDPIDYPLHSDNCGGLPPAGASWCFDAWVFIVNG